MNNLLIVDDEIVLAQLIATVVESSTLRVTVCESALQGLEKLQDSNFDCIISDISMPEMDGVEFLKEIRHRGIKVPFIIYTGFGSDELFVEAAKYGCFDFIEKPKIKGLHEAISRALTKAHTEEA